MAKRGIKPKEDVKDVKKGRQVILYSENDLTAHGSREKLIEALYVARNQPSEMQKLITKAQNEASDRCEKEALKSTDKK